MTNFIGRKRQLRSLKELRNNRSASLAVLRGRRRIGKTRLSEEFGKLFSNSYYFTGLAPEDGITQVEQRKDFVRQMLEQKIPCFASDDWGDLLDDLAEHCQQPRTLVLLDEITWMGSKDPTFIPKLKTTWDRLFKKNPALVLVISGSNSAWIRKKILQST